MRLKDFNKKIRLFIFLIPTLVWSQNRLADFDLVGPVESLQSVSKKEGFPQTTVVTGFLDSELYDSIYLKFDRRRNLILRENFLDYRGKLGLFDRTVYQFNRNNQIEKQQTTLIQNGEESRRISQVKKFYYLKNQLVRIDELNYGRTSNQYWVINSSQKSAEMTEKDFWMDDEVFTRNIYEFDAHSNPIREKSIHNNGQIGKQVIYENNSAGLPLKITNKSGRTETYETFEYGKNYVSKRQVFDEKGGLIRTDSYTPNGRLSAVQMWNYSTKQLDEYRFEYTFDHHNNWVKCVIYLNHNLLQTINRKINYFK